ncbi:MAG: hypothetical protein F9K30_00225 [Dechloromonas sp.]|nr:MAG: hypothetical protein F9K30_00225 [Dechloromonas sp.]
MRTLLANCSTQPLTAPLAAFRIMPAGRFSASDGRPHGLQGWQLNRPEALSIVKLAAARFGDYVIDYEHQTLNTASNGQPNPAAGWFKRLEWREGDGLYVTDARWTERASAMIRAKEYRFISPTFHHDDAGRVLDIINIALTNNPALDGLTDLAAASRRLHGQPATAQEIATAALAYQESMAAAGTFVTSVQAVSHVSQQQQLSSISRAQSSKPASAQDIATAALAYQESMAAAGTFVTSLQAVNHVTQHRK